MAEFFNQESIRVLITVIFGGGGLLVVIAKLIERRVPSADLAVTSQQVFLESILGRVKDLETDRDRLSQQLSEWTGKYWEVQGRYEQVLIALTDMTARCDRLQDELNDMKGRGPIGRSM